MTEQAAQAFEYPIPWWATLLLLFCLGVCLHMGIHGMLQDVAARKAREQYLRDLSPVKEASRLARAYKLPWKWLATSWVLALWASTVAGGLIGIEALDSFFTGAGIASAGSLSSWAGPAVKAGVKRLIGKAGS